MYASFDLFDFPHHAGLSSPSLTVSAPVWRATLLGSDTKLVQKRREYTRRTLEWVLGIFVHDLKGESV